MSKKKELTKEEIEKAIELNKAQIGVIEDVINQKRVARKTKTFKTFKGEEFTRPLYSVDVDYSNEQKCIIFTHGKSNYNLWFLNKAKKLCLVTNADFGYVSGDIWVTVAIDVKGKNTQTKMSLDRFLHLYSIGDFRITNQKFIQYYLKPYSESKVIKEEIEKAYKEILKLEKTNQKLRETI